MRALARPVEILGMLAAAAHTASRISGRCTDHIFRLQARVGRNSCPLGSLDHGNATVCQARLHWVSFPSLCSPTYSRNTATETKIELDASMSHPPLFSHQ